MDGGAHLVEATTSGVEVSSLPSRCRNARPWTRAHTVVDRASGSTPGKVRWTMPRTYSEMAVVAPTRSSLFGSQGSANITRNSAGRSSAKRT